MTDTRDGTDRPPGDPEKQTAPAAKKPYTTPEVVSRDLLEVVTGICNKVTGSACNTNPPVSS